MLLFFKLCHASKMHANNPIMRLRTGSMCFIFCSLLPFLALAYKIDQSCIDKSIELDIRNGMTSAFAMVDAAYRRLDEKPLNPDTLELIGYLFAQPGEEPKDVQMGKTMLTFGRIREYYRAEVTQDQPVPEQDLVSFFHIINASKLAHPMTDNILQL
jgi:hypothetical protein